MNKAEREQYLKNKLTKMSIIEKELYSNGFQSIAGVDEVGRGPLAGPVVAATVVLPEDCQILGIDDSKKLSEKKREELYEIITTQALAIGISFISHDIIDEINILEATKKAMIESFEKANKNYINTFNNNEIDFLLTDAVKLNNIKISQKNIVKGDQKSISIAAASIVAKVTRDRFMKEMDVEYPGYDFSSNKGYGTKKHYEGLREYGPSSIHRKTFLKNL